MPHSTNVVGLLNGSPLFPTIAALQAEGIGLFAYYLLNAKILQWFYMITFDVLVECCNFFLH